MHKSNTNINRIPKAGDQTECIHPGMLEDGEFAIMDVYRIWSKEDN